MAVFLMLYVQGWVSNRESYTQHRGLRLQPILCLVGCAICAGCLAWKAKGEEVGDPQTQSRGSSAQRGCGKEGWTGLQASRWVDGSASGLRSQEGPPSLRRDLGRPSKELRLQKKWEEPSVKPGEPESSWGAGGRRQSSEAVAEFVRCASVTSRRALRLLTSGSTRPSCRRTELVFGTALLLTSRGRGM